MAKRSTTRSRNTASDKSRPEYVPGFRFDKEKADRVCGFLEDCFTMTEGRQWAGKAIKLLPWQREVISNIFGWVGSDGLRRYKRASLWMSKKNGKSTLLAGLALYLLLADGEPGAFVALAACDRHQAGIMFRLIASSIRSNPWLSQRLEIVDSRSTIVHRHSLSRIVAMSADSWRAEGINASAVIVDELHAHKKPDLVQALLYAGASRTQPIFIAISTAGEDRNGIGYQHYLDAKMVSPEHGGNPAANPTYYGKVFEADPNGELDDEANWRKANPSLGTTISVKSFRADFEDAQTNPRKMTAFMRYRLGIWVESDNRWFNADKVAACLQPPPEPLAGRPCWCGIDIASHLDITAAAFLFRSDDGSYDADLMMWVPEETAASRERVDGIPYASWIRDGWLRVTEGSRLDHAKVAADIIEYAERHQIIGVASDPWQAGPIATFLQGAGYGVQSLQQTTAKLNAPAKALESLIVEGKFRYTSPVLQWMFNNTAVYTDPTGSIKPDKAKSREKIDGVVACINAMRMATDSVASWEVVFM